MTDETETAAPAAPAMTTLPHSSNVHSIGRDGSTLLVRFKAAGGTAGKLYRYPGAADAHYDQLLSAESPGSYLRSTIIPRFRPQPGEEG